MLPLMLFVNLCLQHLIAEINCNSIEENVDNTFAEIIKNPLNPKLKTKHACCLLGIPENKHNRSALDEAKIKHCLASVLMNKNAMKPETKEQKTAEINTLVVKLLLNMTSDYEYEYRIANLETEFVKDISNVIKDIQVDIIKHCFDNSVKDTYRALMELNFEDFYLKNSAVVKVQRQVKMRFAFLNGHKKTIINQDAIKGRILTVAKETLESLARSDDNSHHVSDLKKRFMGKMNLIKGELDALVQVGSKAIESGGRKTNGVIIN